MAAPLLLGAAIGIGAGAGGGILGAAIDPVRKSVAASANLGSPVDIPAPGMLLDAFNRKLLSERATSFLMGCCGARWGSNYSKASNPAFQGAWEAFGELQKSVPSVETLMALRVRGLIDKPLFDRMVLRAGADWPHWSQIWEAYYSFPSLGDVLIARNRGLIGGDEFLERLGNIGYVRLKDKDLYARLREQIPGVSDLIRFVVREAFSPAIANELKLYDESPQAAAPWMDALGYHAELDLDITADGDTRKAKWLDLYWAAHWQPISPTQAYQMLHRIRGERVSIYQALGFNVVEFGLDELRTWLKVADYPPGIRDYLAAVAYTPLRLIDIRRVLQYKLTGDVEPEEWAYEEFQDRGLRPDHARLIAQVSVKQAEEYANPHISAIKRRAGTQVYNQVIDGFEDGTLSREQADEALQQIGLDADTILVKLNVADARAAGKLAMEGVRALHRDYVMGAITREEARAALTTIGIQPARRDQYISTWEVQFSMPRKVASSGKIVDWLCHGFITMTDAQRRLANIGWSDPDTLLFLADAQRCVAENEARILKAQEAAAEKAAKEIERILKEQEEQRRRAVAALRRISPVGKLQSWIRKGYIGDQYFRDRMTLMEYTQPEIEYYLAETTSGRNGTATTPAG